MPVEVKEKIKSNKKTAGGGLGKIIPGGVEIVLITRLGKGSQTISRPRRVTIKNPETLNEIFRNK